MRSTLTAAGLDSGKQHLPISSHSDEENRQLSEILRAALNATIPEISANSIRAMDIAKGKIARDSRLLLAGFGEVCKVLAEAETCLRTSIAETMFEEGNPDQDLTLEHAMLSDRMKDYQEEVKAKTKKLNHLWENWSANQDDIVCLAIEQGGEKVLEVDAGASADLLVKMKEAEAAHKRFMEQDESIVDEYAKVQETMQRYLDDAKKESQQHLKEISIQGSRFRRQVKEAIKGMQKI